MSLKLRTPTTTVAQGCEAMFVGDICETGRHEPSGWRRISFVGTTSSGAIAKKLAHVAPANPVSAARSASVSLPPA